jgi:hypothetical protein
MPKVLNKYKDKIPPDAIYVMRPSKWGNPFKIGCWFQGEKLTREDAVNLHKDWMLNSDAGVELMESIGELTGKDLVCCCAPLPCHADILLELANREVNIHEQTTN